jgi:hypothetical protein
MEPERKIEKLLRAFAKKRRMDAGESFDLHPATRRILQAEAARRERKPREENDGFFLRFFGGMKPSRVFAIFFFASLLISACLLFPTLGIAKKKSIGRLANNSQQSDKPAAPAPGSPPASAVAESDARKLPDKIEFDTASAREKTKTDNLQTNVISVAQAERRTEATLDQKKSNEPIPASDTLATKDASSLLALTPPASSSMEKFSSSSNAPTVAAARTPTASASKMDSFSAPPSPYVQKKAMIETPIGAAELAASQRYVQSNQAVTLQSRFKNNVTSQNMTPVLANFELEQDGSSLFVRDEDGSVYKGYFVATTDTPNESARARTQTRVASPRVQEQQTPLNRNSNQAAQNYFFRVAGTNRSLQQNVVFSGNLIANSDSPQAPSQNASGGFGGGGGGGGNSAQSKTGNQIQQILKNQGQQSLFSNSRIAGTAVIGNTNQVEINAVPTK